MKRFSLICGTIDTHPDGPYVLHSDYHQLEQQIDELKATHKAERERLEALYQEKLVPFDVNVPNSTGDGIIAKLRIWVPVWARDGEEILTPAAHEVIEKTKAIFQRQQSTIDRMKGELADRAKHMEETDRELLQIEDWLITNADIDPKTGMIDRAAKCKERIRDLIAAEGENGDLKHRAEKAEAELAVALNKLKAIELLGELKRRVSE